MKKLIIQMTCIILLSSCGGMFSNKSYLQTRVNFYSAYRSGNYSLALNELDKIKYIRAKGNKQLYLLEKGRLLQLMGENEKAAKILNDADELAEGWSNIRPNSSVGVTNFSNLNSINNTQFGFSQIAFEPSSLKYRSEHYERMMINYTKAVCFINMGKKDETLVEAKRLLLLSQQLGDLKSKEFNYPNYVKDPFPELFAGLTFEWVGDYSNAFVSYENAYKNYIDNGTEVVYGIKTPRQLHEDLLRLSYKLGYNDKLEYYQKLFSKKYFPNNYSSELILFIEDGSIPSKNEDVKYFIFDTIHKKCFDNTLNGTGNKLYLPSYQNYYQDRYISVKANNTFLTPTTIRNNNYVVMTTLNARLERERTNLIASFDNTLKMNYKKMLELRKEQEIAQVKAFEAAQQKVSSVPTSIPQATKKENPVPNRPNLYNKNQTNKAQVLEYPQNRQNIDQTVIQENQSTQKNQSRNQNYDNNNGVKFKNNSNNQFNFSNSLSIHSNNYYNNYLKTIESCHVDVRNWLSISAKVSYIRIPLMKNMENKITINVAGKDIIMSVIGTDGLQFKQLRFDNAN
jgi:hypothetical protein